MTGLNCEIVSETLSFCIHGTPVKFECTKCHNEHRLTLLESQIKKIEDDFEYKKDNRKDLNESLIAIQYDYKERISEVNKKLDEILKNKFSGLELRIEKLSSTLCSLSELYGKIKTLENIYKQPHKFPICEGEGKFYSGLCHACEGTGIIWG